MLGDLTEGISLSKGLRQGCPLSPMLYVLVAECLGCSIRASNAVNGFLVPGSGGKTTQITQYADDATLLLRDVQSINHVLNIVDTYGKGTGARLNRTKSEAMWIGKWRSCTDKPFGLKWVTKMRILGVWFGDNTYHDNWTARLDKLESVLNMWKTRQLSIWGIWCFVWSGKTELISRNTCCQKIRVG